MPDKIDIVIETPGGSRAKYKFDKDGKDFTVKKMLPAGMVFPYDFGYIPDTKGEDKDPVDAMVIAEFTTFPGCRIECRLVGALLAEQTQGNKKIRNDRFFFIPETSLFFREVISLDQLSGEHIKQLGDFFINYNRSEGKEFVPLEIIDAPHAWELLKKHKK